jgi:uncharacterized RDD family membrane protein YckC
MLPILVASWSKAGELAPGQAGSDNGSIFIPSSPGDLPTTDDSLASLLIVLPILLFVAYEVLCTAVLRQSLGKFLMQMTVINRESGERLGMGKAMGRAFVLLVSLFPIVGIWNLSSFFRSPDRRGIHDDAADSVVVTKTFSKRITET